MKVGSFVDACLTNPKMAKIYQEKFERTCYAKDDRETYDKESLIIESQKSIGEDFLLTPTEWKKATQLVEFIKDQPFWKKNLKGSIMQMPLEMELEGILVCGLPDVMRIEQYAVGATLYISDLKISSFIKTSSPAKWFYNAKEMGYIRQFAMYRLLACNKYGFKKEDVVCSHMVGIWHEDGLVDAQLYTFPRYEVDKAEQELRQALRDIKAEKFDMKKISWADAIDLSEFSAINTLEQYSEEEEEEV